MKIKPLDPPTYEKVHNGILIGGFILLIIVVSFFSNRFFWDEPYYYSNLDLLRIYGWGENFLRNEWGSAGPLYSFVHYALLPLTEAKLPYIRFINIGLLGITLLLGGLILNRYLHQSPWDSLVFLGLPMTYVSSGIALTEIPSFVFLYLALILFFEAFVKDLTPILKSGAAILAGILFSIAIMGRQPLMVALVAFPVFFFDKKYRTKEKIILVILFILFSLPLPLYVFSIWKGLLAPKEQGTTVGWSIFHFWMGLGYLSLISFIISPKFFIKITNKKLICMVALSLAVISVNYVTQWVYYMPMVTFFYKFIPWPVATFFASVFASILVISGGYYLVSCVVRSYENKHDVLFLFFTLSALVIAFTSIKITHQYSSRYAFQSVPFIILQLSRFQTYNFYSILRICAGISIGIISLYTYIG